MEQIPTKPTLISKEPLINGLKEILKDFDYDNYSLLYAIFGTHYTTFDNFITNVLKSKQSDIILYYGNNTSVVKVFFHKILEQKEKLKDLTFKELHLNAYIHTTEEYILKKICWLLGIDINRVGFEGYQKALENHFTTDAPEKELIIIYYDNIEHLLFKKKQILLYTLLELINCSKNVLIVGLTGHYNLIDLMEKRIRSRFSQKTICITIPGIENVINGIEKIFTSDDAPGKIPNVQTALEMFFSLLISQKTAEFICLVQKYVNLGMSINEILTKIKYILALIHQRICDYDEENQCKDMFLKDCHVIDVINSVVFEVSQTEIQGSFYILLKNFPKFHITLLICLCIAVAKHKNIITIGMIYQEYTDFVNPRSSDGQKRVKIDLLLVKKALEELANSNLINIRPDDKYFFVYEMKLPLNETRNILQCLNSVNKLDNDMQRWVNLL